MGFFSRLWSPPKFRILVVEDNAEVSAFIQDVLAAGGYEVTTAADGILGLASFRQGKFDLLILDYNMPRMGGSALLEQIRAMPSGRKQPVIFLSAERQLDPIYKAYDQGIIEWIPKPFAPDALLAKVSAHLKNPKKQLSAG